jgi:hypothetical protein
VSDRGVEAERGAIAVLVAVFALVMFGLAAIVVDLGMVRVTKADVLAAADAASLAGAAALYDESDPSLTPDFTAAVAAVKNSAEHNGTAQEEWDACSASSPGANWVTAGSGTTCIMFDSGTSPRRLRVVVPGRRVEAAFGGLLGYSGMDIGAASTAQARDRIMQDCSLCVDDYLDVDGDVVVDGDGSAMAGRGRVQSGATLTVTQAAVDAGAGIGFSSWPPSPNPPSSRYSPQPEQASPTDPLAGVFPVVVSRPGNRRADLTCGSGQTVRANFHYRNVTVRTGCNFASGTVFITGRLQIATGARPVAASGTTIFLTCREGRFVDDCDGSVSGSGRVEVRSGGRLDMSGGAIVENSRQLAIVYDEGNSSDLDVFGELNLSGGSVYAPDTDFDVDGQVNIDEGLVAVDDLTVDDDNDDLNLRATGLGSRVGPFRVALVQ